MVNILQLTDTHFFEDPDGELYGINTRASLQAVLRRIAIDQIPYDVILMTGDLVHDETEAGYKALAETLSGLNAPIYYLPGNHDAPHIMETVLHNATQGGFKAISWGNWRLILLDSSVRERVEGCLTQTVLQRLRNELQQHSNLNVLIALHHHAVDVQSEWLDQINLTNNEEFLHLIDAHTNVKVVINGHIHQELYVQRNSVLFLGSPSTCFQFKAKSQEPGARVDLPPGFRHIVLEQDGSLQTDVYYVS